MPQNFLSCEREQVLLMPPCLRDWLPEDHLAWFILASVEQLDLEAFYISCRADGHGRAAHDPAMMVALLVYAYARGQRSSRGIERACVEDIAFRVIAANQVPGFRRSSPPIQALPRLIDLCATATDGSGTLPGAPAVQRMRYRAASPSACCTARSSAAAADDVLARRAERRSAASCWGTWWT